MPTALKEFRPKIEPFFQKINYIPKKMVRWRLCNHFPKWLKLNLQIQNGFKNVSFKTKYYQKCLGWNKMFQYKNCTWKVAWFHEIFFRFVWVLSFSDLFGNDEQWPESSPVSNDIVMLSSSPPASSLEVLCIFCITKWHCSMWCIRSFITYITKMRTIAV